MRFINHGVCRATLILAAGGAAAAESSVTLYGVVDANVQYLSNGGVHSFALKSGGSTGSLFGLTKGFWLNGCNIKQQSHQKTEGQHQYSVELHSLLR